MSTNAKSATASSFAIRASLTLVVLGTIAMNAPSQGALVGLYRFENDSPNLGKDSSPAGSDLSQLFSPTQSSDSKYGAGALGSGGAIGTSGPIPSAWPSGNSSFTIALWHKSTGSGELNIFGYGETDTDKWLQLGINTNQVFTYWYSDDFIVNGLSTNPHDGIYHHFAETYDLGTNTRRLYVDGIQVGGNNTPTGTKNTNPIDAFIEGSAGPTDDVAVFTEALSQTQIQTIMSGDFSAFLQTETAGVPEPSAFILAALGLAGFGLIAWRRNK